MADKRELKRQYKEYKPQMGVFIIKNNPSNKCFIEASHDLKSAMNSALFKLNAGVHPNVNLQKDWGEQSEDNFTVEILDALDYSPNKKDGYQEELSELKKIWMEKLANESEFYK